ncbi:hypothetical protein D9M71_780750 [compost metagenome]
MVARASCSLICSTSPTRIMPSAALIWVVTLKSCGPFWRTSTSSFSSRARSRPGMFSESSVRCCSGMPISRLHCDSARRRSMSVIGRRSSAIRRKVPRASSSR